MFRFGRSGALSPSGRLTRRRLRLGIALSLACGILLALAQVAAAQTTTYTSTQTIPVPPASNYAGNGGGDGWAVALTGGNTAVFPTAEVFNVFHHNSQLYVACHLQSNAQDCPWVSDPMLVQDTTGTGDYANANFATSGQPGLYLDQNTGKLYVYTTLYTGNPAEAEGGVACIDTTQGASEADAFCGFTALTQPGDAEQPGISAISDGVLIGNDFYGMNYVDGATDGSGENQLLCFDVTTFAACAGQPYDLNVGSGDDDDGDFPPPAVAAIGNELIVPIYINGIQKLACWNDSTHAICGGGNWPLSLGFFYDSSYGAPFQLLDSSGDLTGFCLPTGTDQCYDLNGNSVATPSGLTSVIGATSGWNGPAVVIGPRVYVPDGNTDQELCFDYSTGQTCDANNGACVGGSEALCTPCTTSNCPALCPTDSAPTCTGDAFPLNMEGTELVYTVNTDPARPTCLWMNSDAGGGSLPDQIQSFDAYTGGACGVGSTRVLASQFIVPQVACYPTAYQSLQVVQPSPSTYTSGTVTFEDGDGNPISGAPPENLDATGTVSLVGLNLDASGLPQFVIQLNGETGSPGEVVVTLTWTATYDPSCIGPGTTTQQVPTMTSTSLSGGGQSGSSISVSSGTAVTDQASLSGSNSATAGGTVTYSVYSDANCTDLVNGGSAESITTPGTLPASQPVTLTTAGTYYWQAVYSGDSSNFGSTSACGSETETVTGSSGSPEPTSTFTALSGGGSTAPQISVAPGTGVSDQATLSGANAASAGGTVTYNVYSDSTCMTPAAAPMTVSVTSGAVPASLSVTLAQGTYWWTASYSGDALNDPSAEGCGLETEVVLSSKTTGADVGIQLAVDPGSTVSSTGESVICVTVTNYGPDSAKNVLAGLLLPASLTVDSAGGGLKLGRLIGWFVGTMTSGTTITYEVWVNPTASSGNATIVGGALSIGTHDPNLKNNLAAEKLTYSGPMSRITGRSAQANSPLLARLDGLRYELQARVGHRAAAE